MSPELEVPVISGAPDAPAWIHGFENPYLHGIYTPVTREITAENLPVEGELPDGLEGVYLRNGPNAIHPPAGNYHWFDGDGMLHAVEFRDGCAHYRNRWVQTAGLVAEREAGKSLWPGYMDPPDPKARPGSGSDGWLKDTANTDVLAHDGHALALWYQCGRPVRVDPHTLETRGSEDFAGRLPRQVSAHARADAETGELLFFDYATREPYLCYYEAGPGGSFRSVPLDLPGPRLPHDMAITEGHAILMDLPLFWDPALLARGAHKVAFFPELPSRFAVVPRGGAGETRWFEADPAYIYHVVNAWEEGGEIVLDACVTVDPCPASDPSDGPLARMLAFLRLEARLHRYRFDLDTGQTREQRLEGDRNTEFPTIDARRQGRKSRYSYHVAIPKAKTLLFDGLVKYDTETGRSWRHEFGPGRYGSEAPFAPRAGGTEEDDGFVVTFVTDAATHRSEVLVIDARNFDREPLARIPLPQRVPAGFHACWVPGS